MVDTFVTVTCYYDTVDYSDIVIVVSNFDLFGSSPNHFCSCGVNNYTNLFTDITYVAFVDSGTTDPVVGFEPWTPSSPAVSAWNTALQGNWSGFVAEVGASGLPNADPVELIVKASLPPGYYFSLLDSQLTVTQIGSDEWDPVNQTLSQGHMHITNSWEFWNRTMIGSSQTTIDAMAPECGVTDNEIVSDIGFTMARLDWDPVPGAIGYELVARNVDNTERVVISLPANQNYYNSTGLKMGTTFEWQVMSPCAPDYPFTLSGSQTFTTNTPEIPQNLGVIGIGDTWANLTWDAVSGASHYVVRVKPSAGASWIAYDNITGNSVQIGGLSPSTLYDWKVKTVYSNPELVISDFATVEQFSTEAEVVGIDDGHVSESLPLRVNTLGNNQYSIKYNVGHSAVSRVSIYNVEGKMINLNNIVDEVSTGSFNLDLSGQSAGLYFLHVPGEGQLNILKLLRK